MKNVFKKIIMVSLAFLLVACGSATKKDTGEDAGKKSEGLFAAGEYTATAKGNNADLTVKVKVSKDKIESVEVTDHQESTGIADPALKKIPELIVKNQSIAVDSISGCTVTSDAIKEATKAALLKAGASEEAISKAVETEKKKAENLTYESDVIVVGGGGAGMTAALEVLRADGSVVVFEKTANVGGNTIAAGSALNAADETRQKKMTMTEAELEKIEELLALEAKNEDMARWQEKIRKDIEEYKASGATYLYDSADLHKLQTYVGGDYVGDTKLIDKYAEEAVHSVTYLEELGTEWKDDVTAAIGATWNRSHMPLPGEWGTKGAPFVLPQVKKVEELGGQVQLEHTVEELIIEEGKVVGVKGLTASGDTFEAHAKRGVIIATGGFGANVKMRQEYNKHWPDLGEAVKTTNVPSATGDGINLALQADANLVGMEWIQMLTNADKQDFSASINNFIYVNKEGKRYVKEDGRRDEIAKATLDQEGQFCYWITDVKEAEGRLGGVTYAGFKIDELIDDKLMFKADTIEELAKKLDMDPETLQKTIDEYNSYVEAQKDPLGRQVFGNKIDEGPFYANYVTAKVHHTMGGIQINENAQVLNKEGNIIPGLYAAGEVTGGIHGANRLGGNAIADIITFGRIAGQEIMK